MRVNWIVLFVSLAGASPAAAQRIECSYSRGVQDRCGPYACVVEGYVPESEDFPDPPAGTAGFCAVCKKPADCGGAKCNGDGTCAEWPDPRSPESLRPTLFLLTADLAFDVRELDSPLVSVGGMLQVAWRRTHPVPLDAGGWLTADLPRLYLSGEMAVALTGPSQNVFARLGPTYYVHGGPFFLTAVTAGAVYQRQGGSIWDLADGAENFNRLGPFAAIDILYNVRLSAAYAWTLGDGAMAISTENAFLLTITYQRDLLADLIPDRFQKYIPAKYR